MKSYTDINQSKKLAEILPIESADMHYATWTILDGEFIVSPNQGSTIEDLQEDYGNQIIPCWSLAALLELIPNYQLQTQDSGIGILFGHKKGFEEVTAKCPLDTCYEMIIKLHEKNLL